MSKKPASGNGFVSVGTRIRADLYAEIRKLAGSRNVSAWIRDVAEDAARRKVTIEIERQTNVAIK